MKQTVGIRCSEFGQVQACVFEAPEGAAPLATADGVMLCTAQGQTFGRVVWQRPWVQTDDPAPAGEYAAPVRDNADPASRSVDRQDTGTAPTAPHIAMADEGAEIPDKGPKDLSGIGPDEALDAFFEAEGPQTPLAASRLPSVRRVTADELTTAMANERLCAEAREFCRACIAERQLDMKLVDVEMQFDRGKMIFYFTAPTRIDFRELVKDLVRQHRTRIELRQIGVRHETQMVGALGNCGMVCCCRRYLRKFAPVTIKMAKEQNLFLNPAKISGICGRLLCCLSYEQENYDSFHQSCPKLGKRYQTSRGPMRVLRGNMFRNTVSVLPDGGQETEYTLEEWEALEPRRAEAASPLREDKPGRVPGEGRGVEETPHGEARPERKDQTRPAASPDRTRPVRPSSQMRPPLPQQDGPDATGKRRRKRKMPDDQTFTPRS